MQNKKSNRSERACKVYPKAYKGTSKGEIGLELIGLKTREICKNYRFLHIFKYFFTF